MRKVHKYLSLVVAAFWLLQAITGVMLVFHWEMDDWSVAGPASALDPARLSASLRQLQRAHPDHRITSIYPSAGLAGRFDVSLADRNDLSDDFRVDGAGTVLRRRPGNHDYLHIGIFQIATYLHQTLFLHQAGRWFIGFSGMLLLSNIGIGLSLAWPKARQWKRALTPLRAGAAAAQVYSWHRALGLALGIPMFVMVLCGVLLAYEEPLGQWFDPSRPAPSAEVGLREPATANVSIADAISTALALYPGGELGGMEMPASGSPWFKVRVTRAAEARRVFGTTAVYVSSRSGRVLANYDASRAPLKTRVWDALRAVHTGEIGGTPGRALAVLGGVWLSVMLTLGLTLWWLRRRRRPQPRQTRRA